MLTDRRSAKLGAVAGLILAVGVVIGILLSVHMDWISSVRAGAQTVATTAPSDLPAPPVNFAPVVKAVTPAVVNISTTRVVRSTESEEQQFDDPFFRRFFGDEFFRRFGIPRERRQSSLGSGVIVDPAGYIVTNNHVIANADEIKIVMSDKREFSGKVVGTYVDEELVNHGFIATPQ